MVAVSPPFGDHTFPAYRRVDEFKRGVTTRLQPNPVPMPRIPYYINMGQGQFGHTTATHGVFGSYCQSHQKACVASRPWSYMGGVLS